MIPRRCNDGICIHRCGGVHTIRDKVLSDQVEFNALGGIGELKVKRHGENAEEEGKSDLILQLAIRSLRHSKARHIDP